MKPQEIEQKKRPETKGALPGTFLRLCWLVRVITPGLIAAPILYQILESVTPTDFDTWLRLPWTKLLDSDRPEKFDIDLFAHNLVTPNAVTKALVGTLIVLFVLYVTDLRTTGRRQGWHLIAHPMNSSRLREFMVWTSLFVVFGTLHAGVIALRVKQLCRGETALEFVLIGLGITLFALVLMNRNFAAFLLLVPTIEARRKQRREARLAYQRAKQRERHERQLEAKRERDRIRAMRAKIVELQEACREIDADVAYLESSDQPRHLVDEEIAALRLKRSELGDEIDRLTVDLS